MSKIDTTATIDLLTGFPLEGLNTELKERGLPEMKAKKQAATLLAAGMRSQGDVAAAVINLTEGNIEAGELANTLKAAFPTARIGERHGGHFLCHARTGSLKGSRFRPPTANERKRAAKGEQRPKAVTELSAEELARAAEWKAAEEAQAANAK